ncbi:MAG: AtpZ/AtpI family protein [Patescibacteria group bacterium]
MQENTGNNNKPWWEPAVEIFSQVSGWIAGPIILALIAGKWLDSHFGTKPWIFLGLTGVAFIISIFGIIKVVSKYMKKIEQEGDSKKEN